MDRESLIKKAYDLGFEYEKKYRGCSQSTVAAVQDALEIRNDFVFKAASGFPAGCGLLGDGICGGYAGGIMVMSMFFGRRRGKFDNDREEKYRSFRMACVLHDKLIKEYLNYFQVITPMKGGVLGANNLNLILQEYFNPNPKKCVKRGGTEFRLMDKVVHVKNENMLSWNSQEFKESLEASQRRIYNGMSGLLFRMDEESEQAYVFYPNEDIVVVYEYEELGEYLMLSYALTIHKVQGMEYDIVVIPMSFSHYIMHNTKLLYTAVTRAKHKCIVIGESAAFESGCRKFASTQRDTVMLEL